MARALFPLVIILLAGKIHTSETDEWSAAWDNSILDDIEPHLNRANYPCEIDEKLEYNPKCNYRGSILPQVIYQWEANAGCFVYLQPNLMDVTFPKPNITTCLYNNIGPVPCFLITNQTTGETKCHQLDVRNSEAMKLIRKAVTSNAVVQRWIRCSEAANDCCSDVMANSTAEDDYCPPVWDAWSCFDPEKAGDVAKRVCPEFAYSNSGPDCYHYCEKTCYQNATWNQTTNYATCSIISRLQTRARVHVAILATSIGLGLPAVIVLLSYKRLRARRLALHRNLLIAILLRNMLVIITKIVIVLDELEPDNEPTNMSLNEPPCKALASLEKLASSAAFTCMLVDGIFLHRSIVAVFKRELNHKLVYSVAIVVTVIPVVIWIFLMSYMNDDHCWIVYSVSGIQWTLDGPRIGMLVVNTILLIDILRILLTKLNRTENSNQLSTTKATLFLMPLFGVQFLLTAWRPKTTSCDWEQGYYFFTYAMDGLQGIMVAFLYCYLNKEVHMLIRTTYRKTETVVSTRFRSEGRTRRPTTTIFGKRETFSTIVDNKPEDENENNDQTPPVPRFTIMDRRISEENVPGESIHPNSLPINEIDTVNSLTILNNSYSPSDDGFVSLDFEYDKPPQQETSYHSVGLNLDIPPYCARRRLTKESQGTSFEPQKTGEYDVWSVNAAYEEDVPKISKIGYDVVKIRTNPEIHTTENLMDQLAYSKDNIMDKDYSAKSIAELHPFSYEQKHDSNTPQICLAGNDLNNNDNADLKLPKSVQADTQKTKHLNPFLGLARPGDFSEVNDPEKVNLDSSRFSNLSLPNDTVENLDASAIYKERYTNESTANIADHEDSDGWDDVYIDPKKLCPNRPSDEETIFVN